MNTVKLWWHKFVGVVLQRDEGETEASLIAEVRNGKRGKIWFTIQTREGRKLAQNITPGFTEYKAMTEVVRQLEGRKIVIRMRSNK